MMHQACADIIPQSRMRLEVGPFVSFSPCYISGNEGLTPVPKLIARRFPTTFHGVSRCDLQSLSLRPPVAKHIWSAARWAHRGRKAEQSFSG